MDEFHKKVIETLHRTDISAIGKVSVISELAHEVESKPIIDKLQSMICKAYHHTHFNAETEASYVGDAHRAFIRRIAEGLYNQGIRPPTEG